MKKYKEINQAAYFKDENLIVHPGKVLKDILLDRDITQKELAQEIECSESHISNIINERSNMTMEFAIKLAKSLDTPITFWVALQSLYEKNTKKK